jgi:hypothetical protein
MYLYLEIWKAKDPWIRLTDQQRKAKIDQLLQEAKTHPITGVIPFSFRKVGDVYLFDGVTEQPVVIDEAVARPTGFRYAAAWMVPTRELITKFEDRVESLGWWFEYFDQQNAWGVMDVTATVGDMVNANQNGLAEPTEPREPEEPKDPKLMSRVLHTEDELRRLRGDVREIRKTLVSISASLTSPQRKTS